MTEEKFYCMKNELREQILLPIREECQQAGVDHVVDTVEDLYPILSQ